MHWRLVVGAPHVVRSGDIPILAEQLRGCRVTLHRDSEAMDRGISANALGHPALALAFLVDILARQPRFDRLAPGEIVTTGTLTAALPVKPGDAWSSQYDGIPLPGLNVTLTR